MVTAAPPRLHNRGMLLLTLAAAGSVLYALWHQLRYRTTDWLAAVSMAASKGSTEERDQQTKAGHQTASAPIGTELRCDIVETGIVEGEARGAAPAAGTALLKQLRSRKTAAEEPHLKAYYAASRAPKVIAAPQDGWITDEAGRLHRVRQAAPGMPSTGMHGAKAGRATQEPRRDGADTLGGRADSRSGSRSGGYSSHPVSSSIEGDAVMRSASLQPKLVERVNAASEDLLVPSLEPSAAIVLAEAEDAAGWALVHQHNTENACWIVIGGHVLDVTSYLGHHPGGGTIIQKLAGRDATRAYERAHHSRGADMKLADFTVGRLSDLNRLRRAARQAREYRKRLEAAAEYLT